MSPDVQESPISRVVVVVMEQVIGTEVLLESSPQLHRRGPTAGWRRGIAVGKGARVGDGLGECIFRLSHVLEQAQSDGDFLVGLKGKTVNCP